MSISLVKNQIDKFVWVIQVVFALAIICPIIFSYKSHFVQANVICPVLAVPSVPTYCTPAFKWGGPWIRCLCNTCRPPQSESVPGLFGGEKMCLPLYIIKICVVLLKCACRMAFINMCLADNLKDATDCGGLNTCTIVLTHKNLLNAHSYIPKSFLWSYLTICIDPRSPEFVCLSDTAVSER